MGQERSHPGLRSATVPIDVDVRVDERDELGPHDRASGIARRGGPAIVLEPHGGTSDRWLRTVVDRDPSVDASDSAELRRHDGDRVRHPTGGELRADDRVDRAGSQHSLGELRHLHRPAALDRAGDLCAGFCQTEDRQWRTGDHDGAEPLPGAVDIESHRAHLPGPQTAAIRPTDRSVANARSRVRDRRRIR